MECPSSQEVHGPLWVDVQGLLDGASERLGVGELLHGPAFSLFEAMSAIEVGDPRLDAGLTAKEHVPNRYPLRHAVAAPISSQASWLALRSLSSNNTAVYLQKMQPRRSRRHKPSCALWTTCFDWKPRGTWAARLPRLYSHAFTSSIPAGRYQANALLFILSARLCT